MKGHTMPRAAMFGFLLLVFVSGCGFEYRTTVTCEKCDGSSFSVNGTGCTSDESLAAANEACQAAQGYPVGAPRTTSTFGNNECGPLGRAPAPDAAAKTIQLAARQLGLPTRSSPMPVDTVAVVPTVGVVCSREKRFECDCFVERFEPGEQLFVEQADSAFCGDCADETIREFYIAELRHQCEVIYGGQVVSDYRCVEVPDGAFCPPIVIESDAPTPPLTPSPDPRFSSRRH